MLYHKINSVFMRDPETKYKTFTDEFARPEFDILQDNLWVGTEKIHGMNTRVTVGEDCAVEFGGRTERAQIPAELANHLNQTFTPDLLESAGLGDGFVLFGEGYGAGIQKGGGNYRPTQGFILFDVNYRGTWLKRNDVQDIAGKLGIPTVPVVFVGTLREAIEYVSAGKLSSVSDIDQIAEGLVLVPEGDFLDRRGQRIITKLKYRDFTNAP